MSRNRPLFLLSAALTACACTGVIDGAPPAREEASPGAAPSPAPGPGTGAPSTSAPAAGTCSSSLGLQLPRRIWRLSGPQYQATVKAVFPGLGVEVANPFENEDLLGRYSTESRQLQLPLALAEGLFEENRRVATAAAKQVLAQHACLAESPGCAASVIQSLGARMFRRPVTAEEVERYRAFFERSKQDLGAGDATTLLLRALLGSPHAAFIWGVGAAPDGGLSGHEIASAISYVASQRPPDDRLLMLVASGAIRRPEVIEAELKRLVEQHRYEAAVRFFREYLSYDVILDNDKDLRAFPAYTAKLGATLVADTDELVREHLRAGATLADLLTSDLVMIQASTAALYGLGGRAAASGLTRLRAADRVGILTQPAFLASQHEPDHTNPVRVGRQIRENLLCAEVPDPPPDVPALVDQKEEQKRTQTVRERLARHREDPACGACHALLDPLGLPFEGFDALGQKRALELGRPVDVSGELKGSDGLDGPLSGPAEMTGRLARSQQVRTCFVQNAYAYFAGLALEGEVGRCIAERVRRRLESSGEPTLLDAVAATMSDYLLAERK